MSKMNEFSNVLTIGNFDGVHIGHRHLIQTTIDLAHSWGGRAVAITFTPHPKQFFHPTPHFFLRPELEKEQLLSSFGLDEVLYLPFSSIRHLSPVEFFNNILLPLEPAAIVLGENFIFGADKAGDIRLLRRMCADHDVALHSLIMKPYQNAPVSSTRIRHALQSGHIVEATAMLGEPYSLYGHVESGAHRGHTLGFATANIHAPEQVIPKLGAYATRVQLDNAAPWLPAMTAVTQTPTFGNVETVVETHILDFHQDIYGHKIRVAFDAFLRDEMVFCSKDALIKQLNEDCERVRSLNANTNGSHPTALTTELRPNALNRSRSPM